MSKKAKRILIVEDEKPVARALELKLQHSGFESHVVHNGQEAVSILAREKFDLVLLDLVMAKLDGFAVLQELQARRIALPIVVISNLSQQEDIDRARKLGVKDYFVKADTSLSVVVDQIKNFLHL